MGSTDDVDHEARAWVCGPGSSRSWMLVRPIPAPPPPDPLASTARQACGCWRARTTSELCPSRASFLICCSTIVPTIVLCPLSIVV